MVTAFSQSSPAAEPAGPGAGVGTRLPTCEEMPRAGTLLVPATVPVALVVPAGAPPGLLLQVQGASGGAIFQVPVPAGVGPGQTFWAQLPGPAPPVGAMSHQQSQPQPSLLGGLPPPPALQTRVQEQPQTGSQTLKQRVGLDLASEASSFDDFKPNPESTFRHPNPLKRYLKIFTIVFTFVAAVCSLFICLILLTKHTTTHCRGGEYLLGGDILIIFDYHVSAFDSTDGNDHTVRHEPEVCGHETNRPYLPKTCEVYETCCNAEVCCEGHETCCNGVCCQGYETCCTDHLNSTTVDGQCVSARDTCPSGFDPRGGPQSDSKFSDCDAPLALLGWGGSCMICSLLYIAAKMYGLRPDGKNQVYAIDTFGLGSVADKMINLSAPFMLTFTQKLYRQGDNGYAIQYRGEQQFFGYGIGGLACLMFWFYAIRYGAVYFVKGYFYAIWYAFYYSVYCQLLPYILMWKHCCKCFHPCCCDPYAPKEAAPPEQAMFGAEARAELLSKLAGEMFRNFVRVLLVGALCGTYVYLSDNLATAERYVAKVDGSTPGPPQDSVQVDYSSVLRTHLTQLKDTHNATELPSSALGSCTAGKGGGCNVPFEKCCDGQLCCDNTEKCCNGVCCSNTDKCCNDLPASDRCVWSGGKCPAAPAPEPEPEPGPEPEPPPHPPSPPAPDPPGPQPRPQPAPNPPPDSILAADNGARCGFFDSYIAPLLAFSSILPGPGLAGVFMSMMSICGSSIALINVIMLLVEGLPFGWSKKLRDRCDIDTWGYHQPDGACDWADTKPGLIEKAKKYCNPEASSGETEASPDSSSARASGQGPAEPLLAHPDMDRSNSSDSAMQHQSRPASPERVSEGSGGIVASLPATTSSLAEFCAHHTLSLSHTPLLSYREQVNLILTRCIGRACRRDEQARSLRCRPGRARR